MTQTENAFWARGFAEQFLGVVSSAIPLGGGCFYRVNSGRHVVDHHLFKLSDYWLQRYNSHFWRADPLHPRHIWESRFSLQVLKKDNLRSEEGTLEYFEQFLKPQNSFYQIELYFRLGSRIVAGASLLRSETEGAFMDHELCFLERFVRFSELSLAPGNNPSLMHQGLADMTPREREIASLVGEAMCNKEIGRRLNIELPTVKAHVSRVLAKSGVRSRAEFIKRLQSG